MRPSNRTLRNVSAGLLASGLLVGTFLAPAGAHYAGQPDGHVFNTHVRALADARYDRYGSGDHVRTTYITIETAQVATGTTPIPLGGFQFDVGAGQNRFAIVTLTAESACYGDTGYCVVDVLVDGNPALDLPNVAADFAFNSSDGNTEGGGSWESLTMSRVAENLGPGTHTIDIVTYGTGAATNHRVDDAVVRLDIFRS